MLSFSFLTVPILPTSLLSSLVPLMLTSLYSIHLSFLMNLPSISIVQLSTSLRIILPHIYCYEALQPDKTGPFDFILFGLTFCKNKKRPCYHSQVGLISPCKFLRHVEIFLSIYLLGTIWKLFFVWKRNHTKLLQLISNNMTFTPSVNSDRPVL